MHAATCVFGSYVDQKVLTDSQELEVQTVWAPWCRCWKLNSGSLNKQQALSTTEPQNQQQRVSEHLKYNQDFKYLSNSLIIH